MKVFVWGAGGHATVAYGICRLLGLEVTRFIDDTKEASLRPIYGVPVVSSLEETPLSPGIVAIGNCRARMRIASEIETSGRTLITLTHPFSSVGHDVVIGDGSLIAAGAVIVIGTRMGTNVIINTGATVGHGCEISSGAHVASGVHLAGNVSVGEESFVGIGTSVREKIRIGRRCTIGAGSVVVRDVPDDSVVYGNPAILRKNH